MSKRSTRPVSWSVSGEILVSPFRRMLDGPHRAEAVQILEDLTMNQNLGAWMQERFIDFDMVDVQEDFGLVIDAAARHGLVGLFEVMEEHGTYVADGTESLFCRENSRGFVREAKEFVEFLMDGSTIPPKPGRVRLFPGDPNTAVSQVEIQKPSLYPPQWVDTNRKRLRSVCTDPELAADVLIHLQAPDAELLLVVAGATPAASRVLRLRPDFIDRRLELAAAGIGSGSFHGHEMAR